MADFAWQVFAALQAGDVLSGCDIKKGVKGDKLRPIFIVGSALKIQLRQER